MCIIIFLFGSDLNNQNLINLQTIAGSKKRTSSVSLIHGLHGNFIDSERKFKIESLLTFCLHR